MSNPSKDHTSIRVHAPPGGRSNNIFGTEAEDAHSRAGTLAGQFKQAQMKSNIFGGEDPTPARNVSTKNRSNIFGTVDEDEQNKKQAGVRQGLRDPNASRMGYNPINGESYPINAPVNSKSNENEKQQQLSSPEKPTEDNTKTVEAPATNTPENSNAVKTENPADGQNSQGKNVHTSVRVFHPPGGKSSGPLW